MIDMGNNIPIETQKIFRSGHYMYTVSIKSSDDADFHPFQYYGALFNIFGICWPSQFSLLFLWQWRKCNKKRFLKEFSVLQRFYVFVCLHIQYQLCCSNLLVQNRDYFWIFQLIPKYKLAIFTVLKPVASR